VEECGPCPVFASFTLAVALQLRKKGVVAEDASIKDRALQEYLPASSAWKD